jgi:hypothetical protein
MSVINDLIALVDKVSGLDSKPGSNPDSGESLTQELASIMGVTLGKSPLERDLCEWCEREPKNGNLPWCRACSNHYDRLRQDGLIG